MPGDKKRLIINESQHLHSRGATRSVASAFGQDKAWPSDLVPEITKKIVHCGNLPQFAVS
jgi:hypothetical protein